MKIRVLAVLLVISVGVAFAAPMSVQVRNGKVRATPSQLGTVVATVDYGARARGRDAGKGLVPGDHGRRQDRLAARVGPLQEAHCPCGPGRPTPPPAPRPMKSRWRARASTSRSRPSSASEGKLDYTWVDRMSAFKVDANEISQFLTQGHLPGGDPMNERRMKRISSVTAGVVLMVTLSVGLVCLPVSRGRLRRAPRWRGRPIVSVVYCRATR